VSFVPFVNVGQGLNNYEFTIDNINIRDTVSTPEGGSTLALLGLALGGVTLVNLRFRRNPGPAWPR
jgi:hypothetical protein